MGWSAECVDQSQDVSGIDNSFDGSTDLQQHGNSFVSGTGLQQFGSCSNFTDYGSDQPDVDFGFHSGFGLDSVDPNLVGHDSFVDALHEDHRDSRRGFSCGHSPDERHELRSQLSFSDDAS